METNTNIIGYLLINKPKGYSSFYCIKYLKTFLPKKYKIGHTGTLDPFATGLLIICIGRQATKHISDFMNLDKEYVVKAKLGEYTDTLDFTGTIVKSERVPALTKENIQQAITDLGSEYVQIPPIYSALKYQGKPLYEIARKESLDQKELEKIIESKKRTVKLFEIKLLEFDSPYFSFKTRVSKGTYVRSLANDIAQNLKTFATTYELERTKIGKLEIKNAIELTDIKDIEDVKKHLISYEDLKKNMTVRGNPSTGSGRTGC
jgi:tRNA pseudouridine55 synthase